LIKNGSGNGGARREVGRKRPRELGSVLAERNE
jgi:hypothetical protein